MKFYVLDYHEMGVRAFFYSWNVKLEHRFPKDEDFLQQFPADEYPDYASAREAHGLLPDTLNPPKLMKVLWTL